jgi:CheY-like chemotaxis protein
MKGPKPFRILIAEDEHSIREILTEMLIGEGFFCVSAVDGKEASDK